MAVSFVQATGAGTSTTILLPSSRAAGDLLLWAIATENYSLTNIPNGWFFISSQGRGTGGDNTTAVRVNLYGRFSTGAGDTAFNTFSTAGIGVGSVYIHGTTAWRGVSPIDPIGDLIANTSQANAGSHATSFTGAVAYDDSMFVLVTGLAEATTQTFASSTGLTVTERQDLISSQGLAVASAPINAQAATTETITSTHAITPFVSLMILLNPDVPLTVDVTVDATFGAFTGDAEISFQSVTVDASFQAFTGDAELEQTSLAEIDGTFGAFTGDAVLTVGQLNFEIDASFPAFTGSAEILPGQLVGMEGSFGAFYIENDEFYIAMPISIYGTFAGFTGSAEIEQTALVEIEGSFGAFTGEATIQNFAANEIEVSGVFAAFTSEGLINSGVILTVPTDPEYIITIPAIDRTATIEALDRTITVPGLTRTLEVT